MVEEASVAGSKKNAEKEGRTIVFVDESGLSERPYRVRTWAPKGETPVLQYHFHWNNLSAIAGITLFLTPRPGLYRIVRVAPAE
jgi:hypothetical protein